MEENKSLWRIKHTEKMVNSVVVGIDKLNHSVELLKGRILDIF